MDAYHINVEQFQGPLDFLLQLIETQELDVTTVSLAAVADQFIAYLNAHPSIPSEEIADFLVIAARLMVIKSRALLPSLVIDDDAVDLAKQLRMYKEFVEASKKIDSIFKKYRVSFAKHAYPAGAIEGFHPPKKVGVERMRDIFELILKRIEPVVTLPRRIIERIVSIKEKILHIRDTVFSQACVSFQKAICGTAGKGEVIVSFLALLELVKQKIVAVDQSMHFGDIMISKVTASEGAAVNLESEFR